MKRNATVTRKQFTIPIFNLKVYMFKDVKEFQNFINKNTEITIEDDNVGLAGEYEDKKKRYFLATCIKQTSDIEQTVIHEANHLKDFTLSNAGIEDENKEIDSYLLEYIFKKMKAFYIA